MHLTLAFVMTDGHQDADAIVGVIRTNLSKLTAPQLRQASVQTGLHVNTLWGYRRGAATPSLHAAAALMRHFGKPLGV